MERAKEADSVFSGIATHSDYLRRKPHAHKIKPFLFKHWRLKHWSQKLAPFLERSVSEVHTDLTRLHAAYQQHDIEYCLNVVSGFPAFPGYPFMVKGDFIEHIKYACRYFESIANKKIPKVPFFAMQKSASSFVTVILCQLLDIPPTVLSFNHMTGIPSWIRGFAKWGGITHDHYRTDPSNLQLLHDVGIKKCIIHHRHPMDRLISFAYHWLKAKPDLNKKKLTKDQSISLIRDFLDVKMERAIRAHGAWYRSWQQEVAAGRMEILETRYEDMKDDPKSFFKRILNFYNIPYDDSQLDRTLRKNSSLNMFKKYNFRKAAINEWKEVLTPAQADKAKKLIDEEFSSDLFEIVF